MTISSLILMAWGCTPQDNDGLTVDDKATRARTHLSGQRALHATQTLLVQGLASDEASTSPNPFLDVRMLVRFEGPSGQIYEVPGYFAGDGHGGSAGNIWKAHFKPDEVGDWSWEVDLQAGVELALEPDLSIGRPVGAHGARGSFAVGPNAAVGPDLAARGRIQWAGHYLETSDGQVWLKTGTDSPENFLAYAGFEDTEDLGGISLPGLQDGLHRYPDHESAWQQGQPDWNGGDGRAVIGALNDLSDMGVNSVYFLPCNLGGDGWDTHPYVDAPNAWSVSPDDMLNFDVGKLHQWEMVMDHAEKQGIALHFVLNETESANENLWDGGGLGRQRTLFYRELVARFSHHLGVFWNIGEENDYSDSLQIALAETIRGLDPYDNPITVHTNLDQPAQQYNGLVGNNNFELASLQLSTQNTDAFVETWRANSAAAGQPWAVMVDEIGPYSTGVTDTNAPQIRKSVLWPALLSGAAGVEWYAGYHDLPLGGDLRLENFFTREEMFTYSRIARELLEPLPLQDMQPCDGRVSLGDAQCLGAPGVGFAVYLPTGGAATLDLADAPGSWTLTWVSPVDGSTQAGGTVAGGSDNVALGSPPFAGDAVALLQ